MLRNIAKNLSRMPQTRSRTLLIVRELSDGNYQLEHDEAKKKVFLQLDPGLFLFVCLFENLYFFMTIGTNFN